MSKQLLIYLGKLGFARAEKTNHSLWDVQAHTSHLEDPNSLDQLVKGETDAAHLTFRALALVVESHDLSVFLSPREHRLIPLCFWEKCACMSVLKCQPSCLSEDRCLGWGGLRIEGCSVVTTAKVLGVCRRITPGTKKKCLKNLPILWCDLVFTPLLLT